MEYTRYDKIVKLILVPRPLGRIIRWLYNRIAVKTLIRAYPRGGKCLTRDMGHGRKLSQTWYWRLYLYKKTKIKIQRVREINPEFKQYPDAKEA